MPALIIVIIIILFCLIKKYKLKHNNKIKNIIPNINEFNEQINNLSNRYITYKDYELLKQKYKNLYNLTKNIKTKETKKFNNNYTNLKNTINNKNKLYIDIEKTKYKKYFDNLLEYPLDEEQRNAIITDDNNNLVIAGAGSGKTSTMIGKVKYLIKKKNIKPENIIVISFTNQAVENFKNKLKIDKVECTTFHKLGLNILSDNKKRDIASNLLENTINNYLNNDILKNKDNLFDFIKLISLYIHIPCLNDDKTLGEIFEYERGYDLETLKSKVLQQKNNLTTLNLEKVKSYEELAIANYLYINGINYVYEESYKYDISSKKHRQYHPDFYLPDYEIYIEHFGINKNQRAPQYTKIEEEKYLEGIKFKRKIHKKYQTKLIETYSYYFSDGTIFENLEKTLKDNDVKFIPANYKIIYDAIMNQKVSNELTSLKELISKFISLFKGNNYSDATFKEFINDSINKKDIRSYLLLTMIENIYLKYQENLTNNNQIDFNDMINLATKKVADNKFNRQIDYIIIDEFQDISFSRYSLVREIQKKYNTKIICVGDDWQSIFRFSGSDIDMFVNFEKYFEHPKILMINSTHRNSQQLIDIAGNFIMKNKSGQIQKKLKSTKKIPNPITIYYYKNDIKKATNDALKDLINDGCNEVAVIGRNRSDLNNYINTKNFKLPVNLSKIFNKNVVFTTVHSSKGLEYDGTIICNLKNSLSGFPNKMSDDKIINYVSLSKSDFLFDEERRLFYVALTRTKGKCALLVPSSTPSFFIKELLEIGGNKIKVIISEDDNQLHSPNCPKCQTGKLIVRNNNNSTFVGCSNYPKCDFNSKYIDIINNPIKCPNCGGFLVKRKGKYGNFYSCINYPKCTYTSKIEK